VSHGRCRGVMVMVMAPACLVWCIWKERNRHACEVTELSLPHLKFLFLRVLYDWSSMSYTFSTFSFLDLLVEFLLIR
jgi:hypothetical protein